MAISKIACSSKNVANPKQNAAITPGCMVLSPNIDVNEVDKITSKLELVIDRSVKLKCRPL